MEDTAQAEETPRIEINSQIANESKSTGQKSCLRILHVDDDSCILEVSKQILIAENNFEIDDATSVDEAFRKMENQTYDAIVSDYQMPLKNGLDFLKELRKQQKDVPFILFTGKGREEVVVEALNLGADSYLNKHGSPEIVYCELADAINKTVERKISRKLLAASESNYRMLVEKSLQGILVTKAAPLRLVFANETMGKFLGYSAQELMSLSPKEIVGLVYPEDRAVFFKRLENRFRGESAESCLEFRAVRKDGSIIWLEALSNRVEFDGQPAVLGMFLDINEDKKAMEILRESEQRYRELANSLPDIVFETDINGQLVFANERAMEISGYSLRDLEKGLNLLQFLAPEDKERATKSIQRLLAGGSYVPAEYTFVRKDGATFSVLVTASPRISKNKIIGLSGLAIDITERKKAEAVLRKSEEKYRTLVEQSMQGIMIAQGPIPQIVFANSAMSKFLGYSGRELTSLSPQQVSGLVHPDDRELFFGRFKERLEGKSVPAHYEFRGIRKDGTTVWLELSSALIEYDGQPALQGIFVDITERKEAEEALRKNQDLLEALTENLGVGFGIISKDYRVVWVNRYIKNNVGEVEGKQCYSSLNTLDHICPDCGVKKVFEEGVERDSHEYSQIGVNGKPYYVELIATPLKDKNGNVTAALEFVVDIAEKKRMQQKLQANEAKFRAISDSAIDAIFMFDEEDRITYWNPAAGRIFGYTEKEIIGEKVNVTVVPPRFRKDHLKLTSELGKIENKKNMGEIREFPALKKDGTEFSMELSMAPLQLEGKRYFVAIDRDITDHKTAEEKLNQTMNQLVLVNEKLGVVGSLTRHDVRNKLCAMTANAFMIKKKNADQPDIIAGLDKIEQACMEIGKIFDFARTYEQLGVEELTYIDVEKALNESVVLFSGSFNLRVINDCSGLRVLADSFLGQLFYNLIDDSLKHGEKVTKIRVHYEKVDQDKLNLIYEDDGVGIPSVNKSKLFKEGFSTSGSSGYGLHLIKKMIEIYGWAIQENGEPDRGARFTITIPKVNQKGKENFQTAP
jgi:PAS domain S-box-containing protein